MRFIVLLALSLFAAGGLRWPFRVRSSQPLTVRHTDSGEVRLGDSISSAKASHSNDVQDEVLARLLSEVIGHAEVVQRDALQETLWLRDSGDPMDVATGYALITKRLISAAEKLERATMLAVSAQEAANEKTAAEKSAAQVKADEAARAKEAAVKAAADKAAADKAAADKAAANEAAANEAAVNKAAANKAAADKAAADKAEAAKAMAAAKAAAEAKAAMHKAEAERIRAEAARLKRQRLQAQKLAIADAKHKVAQEAKVKAAKAAADKAAPDKAVESEAAVEAELAGEPNATAPQPCAFDPSEPAWQAEEVFAATALAMTVVALAFGGFVARRERRASWAEADAELATVEAIVAEEVVSKADDTVTMAEEDVLKPAAPTTVAVPAAKKARKKKRSAAPSASSPSSAPSASSSPAATGVSPPLPVACQITPPLSPGWVLAPARRPSKASRPEADAEIEISDPTEAFAPSAAVHLVPTATSMERSLSLEALLQRAESSMRSREQQTALVERERRHERETAEVALVRALAVGDSIAAVRFALSRASATGVDATRLKEARAFLCNSPIAAAPAVEVNALVVEAAEEAAALAVEVWGEEAVAAAMIAPPALFEVEPAEDAVLLAAEAEAEAEAEATEEDETEEAHVRGSPLERTLGALQRAESLLVAAGTPLHLARSLSEQVVQEQQHEEEAAAADDEEDDDDEESQDSEDLPLSPQDEARVLQPRNAVALQHARLPKWGISSKSAPAVSVCPSLLVSARPTPSALLPQASTSRASTSWARHRCSRTLAR